MPEGPEIRLQADKIAAALEGNEIDDIYFAFDHLRAYEGRLAGQRVERVRPVGKALLISFANGLYIYSHNQLYGRWYVRKRDSYPNTGRQLRLALHTDRHSALLYSASDIEVLDEEGKRGHRFLSKAGPDVLDKNTTRNKVRDRYASARFRRRKVSALLLDQEFLTGPGNYLRSEILFSAGIHPAARPSDLSEDALDNLARETLRVCRLSYRTRGVTNDANRVKQLKARGFSRSAYRFQVFSRDGRDCYECGSKIEKEEAGARRIYICPGCQPRL